MEKEAIINETKESLRIRRIRLVIIFVSRLLMVGLFVLVGYLAYKGYLTDFHKLKNLVKSSGLFGPVLFFAMQIIQVAIPIFPGGISTIAGVALFGPVLGFLLNYLGICIGSLLGFHIAKRFGQPALTLFFKPETLAKYEKWTGPDSNFTKYFAIAIFLPFAPDDFLCYLAGTTQMSYKTFITIIA